MNATDSRFQDCRERVLGLTTEQRRYLMQKLDISSGESPKTQADSSRVTACIKLLQPGGPDSAELKQFARQHLPDYMVPQQFHVVDDFPRNAAGKIDRSALSGYDWGDNREEVGEPTGYEQPGNEVEKALAEIWAEVLGVHQVSMHDDFYEIGGDSLLSIRILARANKAGLRISPDDFFAYPTVAEQARLVGDLSEKPEAVIQLTEAGLSPIQHWFFERIHTHREQWNQSVCLRVPSQLDYAALEPAVQLLMSHHDMLRASMIPDAQGWRQVIPQEPAASVLSRIDLTDCPPEGLLASLESEADRIHRNLDLEQGGLVRFLYAETPGNMENRLLLVAHHLVVDAESWRIVLDDLESLWSTSAAGEVIELPAKPPSFLHWCARLAQFANAAEVTGEVAYWKGMTELSAAQVPLDHEPAPGANTNGSAKLASASLSADETEALLRSVSKTYRTEITDALLSALLHAHNHWSGERSLLVDVEGHGREHLFDDLDISHTVGWFTTVYPIFLAADSSELPSQILLRVKETIRQVPRRGIGHGMLRYIHEFTEGVSPLAAQELPGVCFNYLGQVDKLKRHAGELAIESEHFGEGRHPDGERAYQLELNTKIEQGRLRLDCIFSGNLHDRSTIESFAQNYMNFLRDLISESQQTESEVYTPSDFPLAELDQQELDAIAGLLSGVDEDAE